jgi:alanine racemase
MGRLGTRDPREATRVARRAVELSGVRLAGATTHLASADADPDFTRQQLAVFLPWAHQLRGLAAELVVHAANSAATFEHPAARQDMVRCGVAIYGLDPFQHGPDERGLQPALTLTSWVAEVKRCAKGQSAGYGRAFVAEHDTWLATLPIGYGDGVRRALGDAGTEVLIDGRRYPLAGRVSMDNITVDLGPAETEPPLRGAEAVLLGRQGEQRILAEEWAARLHTINYEITCGIAARVARSHINEPSASCALTTTPQPRSPLSCPAS